MGSQKRPNEILNTQDQRLYSIKKARPNQTTLPSKQIYITFGVNPEKYMPIPIYEEKVSLYEVLNNFEPVKRERERQPGKEMLVCGKEGIEGYINLGMPLHCFPEDSHMVITFSKTESKEKENNGCFDQSLAGCVVFYIHAVGNREQRILRCRELHEEGTKLCVYGFRGESIKDTLRKDGRFHSFVESDHWKLINNDTIIANTQPVDVLQGKLFQIDVERKRSPWAAAAAHTSELECKSFSDLKDYIVYSYPTLTGEREKLRAYIKKSEKSKKSLFDVHKEKFTEMTPGSISAKVFKLLSPFIDSIGLIVWDNNGNRGRATCFVFRGQYIFTCRHVLNDIVGEGREPLECTDLISQCVRVTFDEEVYKASGSIFNSWFYIEPLFLISDVTLDYAVLKLKENGQQVPAGLYNNGIAMKLSSKLTYLIGYPNGEKVVESCTVILQGKPKEKIQQGVCRTETAGHSHYLKYLHMYTQRSFQNSIDSSNTYNTFYCGSSGSPIFDCGGSLVAMNTAGFICKYKGNHYNVIEFGTSMESILYDIKQKDEKWYNDVCVNQQDVEMYNADYINKQDVDMKNEDYINKKM
ncbi:hypothetical protein HispidOSU_028631 [Sigmodon hispidus]